MVRIVWNISCTTPFTISSIWPKIQDFLDWMIECIWSYFWWFRFMREHDYDMTYTFILLVLSTKIHMVVVPWVPEALRQTERETVVWLERWEFDWIRPQNIIIFLLDCTGVNSVNLSPVEPLRKLNPLAWEMIKPSKTALKYRALNGSRFEQTPHKYNFLLN